MFSLLFFFFFPFQPAFKFPEFQTLTKLKYLKVAVGTDEGSSLLGLIPLIEAAPFLHKFAFKVTILTS